MKDKRLTVLNCSSNVDKPNIKVFKTALSLRVDFHCRMIFTFLSS